MVEILTGARASRAAWRPTNPTIHLELEALSVGLRTTRRQAWPSAEFQNDWSPNSTSACALMGLTGEVLLSAPSTVPSSLTL